MPATQKAYESVRDGDAVFLFFMSDSLNGLANRASWMYTYPLPNDSAFLYFVVANPRPSYSMKVHIVVVLGYQKYPT